MCVRSGTTNGSKCVECPVSRQSADDLWIAQAGGHHLSEQQPKATVVVDDLNMDARKTNNTIKQQSSQADSKPESKSKNIIARKLDSLRLIHFQYCAFAVITCFSGRQLYPLLTEAATVVPHEPAEVPVVSVANGMLHLASFSANFGAQMWVTFVAGLTMFFSLPRHMFGKVQTRLFPMFFLWSLLCSSITLSTYLDRHPVSTWAGSHVTQVAILTVCFLTAAFNSLVISPAIVSAMLKTFEAEVKAGVGDVIGHIDATELKKKDPVYAQNYKQFRRCHALSAIMVVTSLVCNTVYLYYLASRCALL